MWTREDALRFINDERLAVSELALGRKYEVQAELTEPWENGWVVYLSPAEGTGNYLRYVVEKHLEKCVVVGTRGVERAIESLYRDQGPGDEQDATSVE